MEVCVPSTSTAAEPQESEKSIPVLHNPRAHAERVNFDNEEVMEDRDFASHVKGTSTPIDGDSPKLDADHTQTFDTYDSTARENVDSKTADLSSSMEVSSSLTEKTDDRSLALEDN